MNLQEMTDTFKRLESLLANCRARALAGLRAALAMGNRIVVVQASVITGVSPSINTTALVTSASGSGRVRVLAQMQVSIASATSVAGEIVEFQLLQDGSVIAAAPNQVSELSPSHGACAATLVYDVTTTPGSSHTYGIQASNQTSPTHTLTLANPSACVDAAETL